MFVFYLFTGVHVYQYTVYGFHLFRYIKKNHTPTDPLAMICMRSLILFFLIFFRHILITLVLALPYLKLLAL